MIETTVATLSRVLRLVPDSLPGKTRLGSMLLHLFQSAKPVVLSDRFSCTYLLPSFAEPIAQHIFTFGAYEPDTQDLILNFLPEDGTLIDVGANIGALAIPIAKARPRASILCIEADPEIYRVLWNNVKRNGCALLRTVSCIVGAAEADAIPFYPAPKEKFGMGSVGPQFSTAPIFLRQRTLDSLLVEHGVQRVHVMKVDVEGAELGVLRGARGLLSSDQPPVIVFEFVDWAEARIPAQRSGDAQAYLLASGYRLFRLAAGGRPGEEVIQPACQGGGMLVALPAHGRG